MIRKTIFWIHLACGVVTGLVIFSMSITGVILTYEPQINQWVAESHYLPEAEQTARLSLDQLVAIRKIEFPDVNATQVTITNHPGAPFQFRAGRRGGVSLNPYTGMEMETESASLRSFWSTVTGFHRWFDIQGENRAVARQVTGVSNLAFLFLILSGLYLWLPSIYRWGLFKARLLFRPAYNNSKERDYHWHHIFGIWMAAPLVFIVYTGAMFNYGWSADLVYSAFGTERAVRGGPGTGRPAPQTGNAVAGLAQAGSADLQEVQKHYLTLEELVSRVIQETDIAWNRINVSLPDESRDTLSVELDWGNGAQAQKRETLLLDRSSGSVLSTTSYAQRPLASKIQGYTRFGHTGEIWGWLGQTIAGLASLAALFMVWTGFALSYRRLIKPFFK